MKKIAVLLFIFSIKLSSYCQPSAAKVQADIKSNFGPKCISVTVTGGGTTSVDYINGGYAKFYRVPVTVKSKTELPGVVIVDKGNAKYNMAGAAYSFKEYASGTTEYSGLPYPDTAAIRSLIYSLPSYGITGPEEQILDVHSISFLSNPAPIWHSLLSVTIASDMVYSIKRNMNTVEKIKEPYGLRLYRKTITDPWYNVAWTTPDYRNDSRRLQSISVETIGEYKLSKMLSLKDKATIKSAEIQAASRPKVDIPVMNSMQDLLKWYHGLLMEGDYAKVEAVTLQLFSPENFDSKTNLLNGNAAIQLETIKKAITNDFVTYQQQYCTTPKVRDSDNTYIAWFNKDKSQSSTIEIRSENNRWYITKVSIGFKNIGYGENAVLQLKAMTCN